MVKLLVIPSLLQNTERFTENKSCMNVRNVLRSSVVPVPFGNMNHPGGKPMNEYNVGTPSFLSYLFQDKWQCPLERDL
jgi:hypothetical protein